MSVTLGSDPEFFIRDKGKKSVRGSEEFIQGRGIKLYDWESSPTIVRDGVQVEINPQPSTCREGHFGSISGNILRLHEMVEQGNSEIAFEARAFVAPESFEKLSKDSKMSGCNPVDNAHGIKAPKQEMEKSRLRCAGGHVHVGGDSVDKAVRRLGAESVVKMMDIVAGNTLVMVDQFPGSKERRRYYGKAGEYRVKPYGLEYRVPSNFWLRDYRLYGLTFGLVRLAVGICNSNVYSDILDRIDMKDVVKAINSNDPVLAKKNFDKIKDILSNYGYNPFGGGRLQVFEAFVKVGGQFAPRTIEDTFYSSNWRGSGWESWCSYAKEKMERGQNMLDIMSDDVNW